MMLKSDRQACFEALLQVMRDKAYSNLALNNILKHSEITGQAGFVSALFYGVIERDITLAYVIDRYSKRPCHKLDIEVAVILKMGLYQILYMEQVPDSAAVNESVKLCYSARKASAKGMVNAVLRAFIRDGKQIPVDKLDRVGQLSISHSCPAWLIELWEEAYSPAAAERILRASTGRPPLTVRVNTLKTDADTLVSALKKRGISAEKSPYLDDALLLAGSGSIEGIPEWREGHFYVQDLSSQFCGKLVGAAPGMIVMDLCSAPGSKAFTIAQYMRDRGEIFAFDQYKHKLSLIRTGADRLGIMNIRAVLGDAAKYNESLPKADRVLCDVPCSGLGIIRRKPEIKYKSKESLRQLPNIQYEILENGAKYVKRGGKLIYSTCSLNPEENERIVFRFLSKHPAFMLMPVPDFLKGKVLERGNTMTFLPEYMDSDGFFAAVMLRNGDTR